MATSRSRKRRRRSTIFLWTRIASARCCRIAGAAREKKSSETNRRLAKGIGINDRPIMATTLRVKGKKRKAPAENGSAKWVGQPIRRKEEDRLVRGKGIFVDDQKLMGML